MFNNTAIDVCLGLVFIFLLYSLMASIIQEIVARWCGLRARTLLKALRRMLQGGDSNVDLTFLNAFIDIGNNLVDYFRPLRKGSFLKAFYDYPSIKYLGENNTNSKPSYIDAATFSKTLIQMLRGEGYNQSLNQMQAIRNNISIATIDDFAINAHTQRQLSKLWTDASNDIDRFKENLEEWFNGTMNRATGWYKKQTQLLLFIIGIGLAGGFNVDTIAIGKILANNEGARKEMVNLAVNRQKKYEELTKSAKDSTVTVDPKTKVKTVVKYVGLRDDALEKSYTSLNTDAAATQQILGLGLRDEMKPEIKEKYQPSKALAVIGWILTALAISLGAPFWFDILNKIISLRSAGAKPVEKGNDKTNTQLPSSIKPVG